MVIFDLCDANFLIRRMQATEFLSPYFVWKLSVMLFPCTVYEMREVNVSSHSTHYYYLGAALCMASRSKKKLQSDN